MVLFESQNMTFFAFFSVLIHIILSGFSRVNDYSKKMEIIRL